VQELNCPPIPELSSTPCCPGLSGVSRSLAYGVAFTKESADDPVQQANCIILHKNAVRAPWLSVCRPKDDKYCSINSAYGGAETEYGQHYLVDQVKSGFPIIFQFMKRSCAHSLQSPWITTGGHPQFPRPRKPSTPASESSFILYSNVVDCFSTKSSHQHRFSF
jgi:hypothetical protein